MTSLSSHMPCGFTFPPRSAGQRRQSRNWGCRRIAIARVGLNPPHVRTPDRIGPDEVGQGIYLPLRGHGLSALSRQRSTNDPDHGMREVLRVAVFPAQHLRVNRTGLAGSKPQRLGVCGRYHERNTAHLRARQSVAELFWGAVAKLRPESRLKQNLPSASRQRCVQGFSQSFETTVFHCEQTLAQDDKHGLSPQPQSFA